MLDLISLFESLEQQEHSADDSLHFTANPILPNGRHRLAKDSKGLPCILVAAADGAGRSGLSPIALENITVQHNVECRISRANGRQEAGRFTVIRCTGIDSVLHTYFLRICGGLISSIGEAPSQASINQMVASLVELFRVMKEPARKSVQGLWAELFTIARSPKPESLVSAWHAIPGDLYDFAADNYRIEVKSSANRIRAHHFRFEQINPQEGAIVLVASVFVERLSHGVSLSTLVDQLHKVIGDKPQLVVHLDRVIGLTLGDSWQRAFEDCFDYELATSSFIFFESSTIPSISANVPPEVREIHFISDLTRVPAVNALQYKKLGGLFEAAI